MEFRDKNYKSIQLDDIVNVPKPRGEFNDDWNFSFTGSVTGFTEDGYVIVEDLEKNSYCIEPEILDKD